MSRTREVPRKPGGFRFPATTIATARRLGLIGAIGGAGEAMLLIAAVSLCLDPVGRLAMAWMLAALLTGLARELLDHAGLLLLAAGVTITAVGLLLGPESASLAAAAVALAWSSIGSWSRDRLMPALGNLGEWLSVVHWLAFGVTALALPHLPVGRIWIFSGLGWALIMLSTWLIGRPDHRLDEATEGVRPTLRFSFVWTVVATLTAVVFVVVDLWFLHTLVGGGGPGTRLASLAPVLGFGALFAAFFRGLLASHKVSAGVAFILQPIVLILAALVSLRSLALGVVVAKLATLVGWQATTQLSLSSLLRPLAGDDRAVLIRRTKTFLQPLGVVAGAVAFVLLVLVGPGAQASSLLAVGLAAIVLLVAPVLVRENHRLLDQALERRQLDGLLGQPLRDENAVAALWRGLDGDHKGEVLYCLDLLERLGLEPIETRGPGLLAHADPTIRAQVIQKFGEELSLDSLDKLMQLAARDPAPDVRAAATRVVTRLGEVDEEDVPDLFSDPQRGVRRAAMVGLLEGRDLHLVFTAGEQLKLLASSSRSADRQLACDVLGDVDPSLAPQLLPLLSDPDPVVRRAALQAAGHMSSEIIFPPVVEALGRPGTVSIAGAVLAEAGAPAVAHLLAGFDSTERAPHRRRISAILLRIGAPDAFSGLWERLSRLSPETRQRVLERLSREKFRIPEEQAPAALEELERDRRSLLVAVAAAELGEDEELTASLRKDIAAIKARIGLRLDLLSASDFDRSAFDRAVEATPEQLAADAGAGDRLLAAATDDGLRVFTRALATRQLQGLDSLQEFLGNEDELIRETALYRLNELDPEVAAERLGALAGDPCAAVAGLARSISSTEENAMLMTIEKILFLKAVSIFESLDEEELAHLAGIVREIRALPGERILEKGDIGSFLYIVVVGKVRIHDGDREIDILGERSVVGELAALDPEPRSASVTAIDECLLFRIDQDALSELMADRPEVARNIIRLLCQRLRH